MKHLIFIFILLISINCKSQNTNNSFGIGLGTLSMESDDVGVTTSTVKINSPFYNTKSDFFGRTITAITSPSFYLGKRLYKNLFLRLNGNYNYRTSYLDWPRYTIQYEPNTDRDYYNNLAYLKTLNTNLGLQYNIKLGKLNIYPAIEYALIINWITMKDYYTIRPYNDKSYEQTYKEKEIRNSINTLCGFEYCIKKNLSISYETSITGRYFYPISRLSINLNY